MGVALTRACLLLACALLAAPSQSEGVRRQDRSLLQAKASTAVKDISLAGACKNDIINHCAYLLTEPQRAIVFGTKPESSVKTPVIAAEEAKPTAAAATTSTTKEQSTTGTAAANVTAATSTPANAGGGNARQASDASATAIDIAGAAKAAAALVDVENYEADEQVAVALTLEKSDARAAAIAGGGAQAGAVSGAQAGAGGGAQAGAGGGGSGGARRRLLDTEDDEALQTLLPLLQLDGSLTIPALLAATAPLAHCLKKAMHQSDLSISPDADQVSDECELEVRDFYISRNADVRHDLPLVGLCAADLATWCSQGTSPTKMMECLKERKEMLKPRCKGAVAQRQMDAAEDISLVPELNAACGDDRARHCKTAGWGEGAALACLLELWRKTPSSLNPNCSHGLMTYMAEQAEDIRFNFKLAASCSLDKQIFCRELRPDDGVVLDCLEAHRLEPRFTLACKTAVEDNLALKVMDSRLDHRFKAECGSDVEALCKDEEANALHNHAAPLGAGAAALECMRRNLGRIRREECKQHVYHLVTMAFADNRLDSVFAAACDAAASKYCPDQMPNSILCLKQHLRLKDDIPSTCASMVDERLHEAAADLNFSPALAASCAFERNKFCASAALANKGKALDCLIDHRHHADFGADCKKALVSHLELAVSDIRLMSSLRHDCEADAKVLCPGVQPGEGRVIRCLSDKRMDVTDTECKRSILRLLGFVVEDARLDYQGQQVCKADAQKFCAGSPASELHACLRKSEAHLSPGCREHQKKMEALGHEDVRLNPRLQAECPVAVSTFCKDVKPGNANVLTCLTNHMLEEHFPFECREVLEELLDRSSTRYHLNAKLVDACETDVFSTCTSYGDGGASEDDGRILSCLSANVTALSPECRRELSASVRTQFKRYRMGTPLTAACDGDVMQWCNVDQLSAPFIETGFIQTCLVQHFFKLHPPCWALISTFDEAHMAHAKEMEASWKDPKMDEQIQKVAAEVRRDLEPRLISNIANKVSKDILGPYKQLAPRIHNLVMFSGLMVCGFAATIILVVWMASRSTTRSSGVVVHKDGRV